MTLKIFLWPAIGGVIGYGLSLLSLRIGST